MESPRLTGQVMRFLLRCSTAFAALFGAAFSASAQDQARAGSYELAEAAGPRRCRLVLAAGAPGAAIGEARLPAGCRRAFPVLRNVQHWRPEAVGMTLLAPGNTIVVTFAAGSGDVWRTTAAGQALTLTRVGEDARTRRRFVALYQRPAPAPRELAAPQDALPPRRFRVLRQIGQEGACSLDLTDRRTPSGDQAAELRAGCPDSGLITFAPAAWRIEGGRLVLISRKGHDVRFAFDSASKLWRKDPPSGAALFLAP
jgi:hypothetical protein